MKYYVNQAVETTGNGSEAAPFKTINEAAAIAAAGDEVLVAPGIYRENVNPINVGTADARITYKSLEPLGAVITGAEPLTGWEPFAPNVWMAKVDNEIFGDYNPFATDVYGDWFDQRYYQHTGDIFLGEKSLYEVDSIEKVLNPVVYKKSWDSAFSVYTWYAEVDEKTTTIYANFQGKDPNAEEVQMTVRQECFYPQAEGVGYITLDGFSVKMAATQWAPPTAIQDGMIGPHWSKGWIIENCEVSNSKCSGISLGKYYQEGNDNKWSEWKFKDGTQTQRDCSLIAQLDGWSKETIGSHIVRNCNIHDCGQTGIVGNLGCVFSVIENNHIHHINNKQNLAGAEIGGIKLHAAIDVILRGNHFHHCTRGVWLDWQAQGTRVTGNLFHDNTIPDPETISEDNIDIGEDLFIEIAHGPTLVDNNIFLSDYALKIPTQGLAIVHNFIAGSFTAVGRGVNNGSVSIPSPRYTPIHRPHETAITGFMTVLHGDNRFYNNIFLQKDIRPCMAELHAMMKDDEWTDANLICGTIPFEDYPSYEEYAAQFQGYCGMGSPASNRYYDKLPVWAGGNLYFNGAKPMSKEKDAYVDVDRKATFTLGDESTGYKFETNVYDFMPEKDTDLIDTDYLGIAFEPEEAFENPDGSPIVFDTDYYGKKRDKVIAGPFA